MDPDLHTGISAIYFRIIPLPDIDAGNDTTIQVVCGTTSFQLNAIINSNSIDAFWWTDGDGVFDNTGSLNPVYTPGTNDISNGMAKLFCKTYSIFMCSEATDTVNVYFQLPEIFSSSRHRYFVLESISYSGKQMQVSVLIYGIQEAVLLLFQLIPVGFTLLQLLFQEVAP
ncbi:MAG: hypothetical protein IPP34_14625 [Bacteroidetes bacterium]|nr:hypothetical protein [Bacteroidota bacterium]